MRWWIGLTVVIVVVVVLAGGIALMTLPAPGSGNTAATAEAGGSASPSDRALAMVQEEIAKASPDRETVPTDWQADAMAWVVAHRDEDWPYAELEAWTLARIAAAADGEAVSPRWVMEEGEHQIDLLKALDTDGDGKVSDEEVAAYAMYQATIADPRKHPYVIERFDTNGDGVLGPDEAAWLNVEQQVKRQQAMADRARIDLWDTNNDGALSEAERETGHAALLLKAQIFPDGHIEYVADPGSDAATSQAEVREQFAAEFGQDMLDLTLRRQELAADTYLPIELGQDLQLITTDIAYQWEPGPPMPDTDSFDRDGDGSLNQEELAASLAAMEAWEQATRLHSATQSAERFRLLFEAQAEAADADYDGLLFPEEWDRYRDELIAQREDRLFLQHYDLDGNGRVESPELETFVAWYRAGSLRADVNYDGSVDVQDLEYIATRYKTQDP